MAIEHIRINIETGNAAFEDSPTGEIARILRDIADQFERNGTPSQVIRDISGNYCGEVVITEGGEDE